MFVYTTTSEGILNRDGDGYYTSNEFIEFPFIFKLFLINFFSFS